MGMCECENDVIEAVRRNVKNGVEERESEQLNGEEF